MTPLAWGVVGLTVLNTFLLVVVLSLMWDLNEKYHYIKVAIGTICIRLGISRQDIENLREVLIQEYEDARKKRKRGY